MRAIKLLIGFGVLFLIISYVSVVLQAPVAQKSIADNEITPTVTDAPTQTIVPSPTDSVTPTQITASPSPTQTFNVAEDISFECIAETNNVFMKLLVTNNGDFPINVTATNPSLFNDTLDYGTINAADHKLLAWGTSVSSIPSGTVKFSFVKTSDSSIKNTIDVSYQAFSCTNPTITPTETPSVTPTDTAGSGTNNCDNTDQSNNNGGNNNDNCNQQQQDQEQDQYNNNNQIVNVTFPAQETQLQQLPNTGTPVEIWEMLGSMTPLGFILRKFSKK